MRITGFKDGEIAAVSANNSFTFHSDIEPPKAHESTKFHIV